MANPSLSRSEKLSYGLGDLASNLSWNLISGFLLFFYVNVALIPVAMAGTLILVSMILSALLDPLVGIVVDRTNSRFGKARPYLLYGSIPLGLASFFLFLSPLHSVAGKVFYAYVTLIVVELLYAAVNIPYGTMMPLMTRQPDEKMQLSSLRTIGSSVGTFMATGLTMPIVALFGNDRQKGFACVAAIFATALTLMFLVVFKNCKERYQDPFSQQKGMLGKAILNLARNRSWRVTFIFGLLMLMRLGALIASTAFFCIQVLHEPKLISLLLPILSATSLCVAPLAPAYFRRFGIRAGIVVVLVASIGLLALLPFLEGRLWAFVAVYTLAAALSVGLCTTAIYAMAANSVDHQQWQYGMRNDGLVYSSVSIATKIGIAVGASSVAYALAWAGFDALHPGNSAIGAIRAVYYGAPILVMALQIVCISFYNLDRLHPQIVADLNARSTAATDIQNLTGATQIEPGTA
jgi:GPH family glycoside/pentoside/hexuronide:cation symporter